MLRWRSEGELCFIKFIRRSVSFSVLANKTKKMFCLHTQHTHTRFNQIHSVTQHTPTGLKNANFIYFLYQIEICL